MEANTKPILSYIGYILFILTLVAHISFKTVRTNDVGVAMLLSLANALLLIYPLIWGLIVLLELRNFMRSYKKFQMTSIDQLKINEGLKKRSNRHKINLTIITGYLVIIFIQLIYVIYNWDEVNI